MLCKIDSLYICVDDMDRAIKFYEDFLSKKYRKREKSAAVLKLMVFDSTCLPIR